MSAEASGFRIRHAAVRHHWIARLFMLALVFTAVSYAFQALLRLVPIVSGAGLTSLTFDMLLFDPFDWQDLMGTAPVLAIVVFELMIVGWDRSSLRRLVFARSESAVTDWAFLLLLFSGLYSALISISGLGLFAFVHQNITGWRGLGFFSDWPLWMAIPALYLFRSFFSYWLHRMQHSRWFWELHKTHHAAREFTSLNYIRAHPLELAIQGIANAVFYAALGFPGEAIVVFEMLANVQLLINHSNIPVFTPLEKIGLVTPAAHRIHHGLDERYHNSNFGELLNIWDRLFGTYLPPTRDSQFIVIGVSEANVSYNSTELIGVFWAQAVAWFCSVRQHYNARRDRPHIQLTRERKLHQ